MRWVVGWLPCRAVAWRTQQTVIERTARYRHIRPAILPALRLILIARWSGLNDERADTLDKTNYECGGNMAATRELAFRQPSTDPGGRARRSDVTPANVYGVTIPCLS
jgi:hypothetical protein